MILPTGETQGGCKVCIWWTRREDEEPDSTWSDYGNCHYEAPQSGKSFGETTEDGYCRQWEAREEETKPEEAIQ